MSMQSVHGLVLGRLIRQVVSYLETHSLGNCYVGVGCRLFENEVVQPDICVLLNEHLARAQDIIIGPPDWAAEVLDDNDNPFNVTELLNSYRRAGVREVWMVSPRRAAAWVGVLHENGWEALPRQNACIESKILEGFQVDFDALFSP